MRQTKKEVMKRFLEDAFTDEKPLSQKNTLVGKIARCEVSGFIFTATLWLCIFLGLFMASIALVMSVFLPPGYFIEKDKEENWETHKKEEVGY